MGQPILPVPITRQDEWYYSHYYTVNELLKGNMSDIIDRCADIFTVIDGVKDRNKIIAFMTVMFQEIEAGTERVFSRYKRFDSKGQPIAPDAYYSTIANKLYQCTLPFYQQKGYFNAAMDLETINDLLTETNEVQASGETKVQASSEGLSSSEGSAQAQDFLNGSQQQDGDEFNPKYVTGGSKSSSNGKGNTSGTSTGDNTSKSNVTSTRKNIKADYLRMFFELSSHQGINLETQRNNFIRFIAIPNQNIEFNVFPWPWTFTRGANLA